MYQTTVLDMPETTVLDMPEDVLIHILSFHHDADMVEAMYDGRPFLTGVRRLLLLRPVQREAFREACAVCGHHAQFCDCEERSKRIGTAFFLFVLVFVLLWMMYPFMK